MKLFIFILLSFCFLNSGLVYATDCFKPTLVKKDLKKASKKVSIRSNKQIQKPIPKHILEEAQKSVWKIKDSLGSGTGFFISRNKFVTNFHVVIDILERNTLNFSLNQEGHSKTLKVKKVKHLSPRSDLAILEIEGEVSDYLNLAKKDPHSKENLSLIGYPNGKFKIINKVYDISYKNDLEYNFSANNSSNKGASGAPVLNQKGEVAGVFYANNTNRITVIKTIHLQNLLKQDSPFFENPKDHLEHSIKELEQVAEGGDMIAQFNLGFAYEKGLGVEQDLKKTFFWHKKAAEQGYAPAQHRLGARYLNGLGIKEDRKEAARWFRKAAEQGYAPAQYNMGVMYANGWGVKQDFEETALWYQEAGRQGYVQAQYHLGILRLNGLGVVENYRESFRLLNQAKKQGYGPAQTSLGVLYLNGWGVEQNYKEALRLFNRPAKQGYAEAQYNMGVMYANGWGVETDFKEAARLYGKAAEQKYEPAQFNLGILRLNGWGVKKDPKEALRLLDQAKEQGYVIAQDIIDNPKLLKFE